MNFKVWLKCCMIAGIWHQRQVLGLVLAPAEGLPHRIARSGWAGWVLQKSPWVSDVPAVSGVCLCPPGGAESISSNSAGSSRLVQPSQRYPVQTVLLFVHRLQDTFVPG